MITSSGNANRYRSLGGCKPERNSCPCAADVPCCSSSRRDDYHTEHGSNGVFASPTATAALDALDYFDAGILRGESCRPLATPDLYAIDATAGIAGSTAGIGTITKPLALHGLDGVKDDALKASAGRDGRKARASRIPPPRRNLDAV